LGGWGYPRVANKVVNNRRFSNPNANVDYLAAVLKCHAEKMNPIA
jgi:hypothetical protein